MSGNIASSLRCSSRLKSAQSPYFNGAVNRPKRTSPYFASTSATADDPVTPTKHESKRKDSGGSKKSANPSKKLKPSPSKVERTKSFEPAWWGNVLVNRTQSTLALKSANQHALASPTKTNYPPIHTLIVGTHPSIVSLSSNQFYGHPLNAFWYLVGDSMGFRRCAAISPTTDKPYANFHAHLRYGMDKIIDYDQQLETFVSKGFALWDIVQECERKGSLDTDIKVETSNPIREFCDERGSVKRIVIANGTTGGKFFVKHFKDWFTDGGLVAGEDELSQRVFKAVMNSAKKMSAANVDEGSNGGVIEVVCLPSVSPAAAKFSYLEKRELWEKGCFEPGLSDYESWKNQASIVTPTPLKRRAKQSLTKTASAPSSSKVLEAQFSSSDIARLTPENDWVDLHVSPRELRPSATLTNGQCFNWMVVDKASTGDSKQSAWGTHDAKEWVGPLMNRVLSIKETPTTTLYRVLHGSEEGATDDLCSYFRLETPLAPLYKEWSETDDRLAKIATVIPGCRILRQDPVECMFSFICSSNNNIPRITKMLTSFRQEYGDFMMKIPTKNGEEYSIYSFPTLDSLSSVTEQDLRAMGLGYRAKYMTETRDLLKVYGGRDYLMNLRSEKDAQVVQETLIEFSGIGRKVADCIALFSLDQDNAIPVDVHVQHIASRDYDPTVLGSAKSITPTIYKQVGDLFRSRFPSYSGWAHSLLFVAELPSFRDVIPVDVVQEMDKWREHEQRRKKESKNKKSA